jgi:hypothetical protein
MEIPETRYAETSDGVHIAYQVLGQGAGDLVFVPGFEFNGAHKLKGVPDRWRLHRVVVREDGRWRASTT